MFYGFFKILSKYDREKIQFCLSDFANELKLFLKNLLDAKTSEDLIKLFSYLKYIPIDLVGISNKFLLLFFMDYIGYAEEETNLIDSFEIVC